MTQSDLEQATLTDPNVVVLPSKHAVLAVHYRRRILQAMGAQEWWKVSALSMATGIVPDTVRYHLEALQVLGRVVVLLNAKRVPNVKRTVGRPAHLWRRADPAREERQEKTMV